MASKPGMEWRVRRYFAALTLLLSLCYGALVLVVAYITEDGIIGRLLQQEIVWMMEQRDTVGVFPEPRLPWLSVYPNAELAPVSVRELLQRNPDSTELFTPDERHYHVRWLPQAGQAPALLVAEVSPLLVVTRGSPGLMVLVASVFLAMLLVALWLANSLARRTVQPLLQLSEDVQRTRAQFQPVTFRATQRADEIGYLARTLQDTMNGLTAALERESQFTRDASHELRTPVTVMKNSLALIAQRGLRDDDLVHLERAVSDMQDTVATLLALARQESLQVDSLDLRQVLEEAVLARHDALSRAQFEVVLNVPVGQRVQGNRQLLSLLAGNLIDNALRYADTPQLDIELQQHCLVFRNSASEVPPADLTEPTVRRPDSPGIGQGLYLVRRIVEGLGWEMETAWVENRFLVRLHISP